MEEHPFGVVEDDGVPSVVSIRPQSLSALQDVALPVLHQTFSPPWSVAPADTDPISPTTVVSQHAAATPRAGLQHILPSAHACALCHKDVAFDVLVPCGHVCICRPCYEDSWLLSSANSDDESAIEVRCPQCMKTVDCNGSVLLHRNLHFDAEMGESMSMFRGLIPRGEAAVLVGYGIDPISLHRTRGSRASSVASRLDSHAPPRRTARADTSGSGVPSPLASPREVAAAAVSDPAPHSLNSPGATATVTPTVTPSGTWKSLLATGADVVDPFGYEGLGVDYMESGPWVPPSLGAASVHAATRVVRGGNAPICGITENDLGSVHVGITLYFSLLKWLTVMFVVATLFSAPALSVFAGGSRIPQRLADPFGFGHYSLGNAGPVSLDTATSYATQLQAAGTTSQPFNVTNATLLVAGTAASMSDVWLKAAYNEWLNSLDYSLWFGSRAMRGSSVSFVLTSLDAAYTLMIALLCYTALYRMKRTLERAEEERVSPAHITVMVKHLPPGVTEAQLRDHFSRLGSLNGSGLDVSGRLPGGRKNSVLPVLPTRRLSAAEGVPAARPGTPHHDAAGATGIDIAASKQAVASWQQQVAGGIVSCEDPHVRFSERIEALRHGTVRDASYTTKPGFVGSWVADVHIVSALSLWLDGLYQATSSIKQLRRSRAQVKMYGKGTVLSSGMNNRARERAERAVATTEVDVLSKLTSLSRNFTSQPESLGVAFVTFNQEESYSRTVLAYAHSNWPCIRCCQPKSLRWIERDVTHRSADAVIHSSISVEPASDPGDVLHHNLGVTDVSRCLRQAGTALATVFLLAVGFAGMVTAQSYSKRVSGNIPDLTLCTTEIPSTYLGSRSSVQSAREALAAGYGGILEFGHVMTSGAEFRGLGYAGGSLPVGVTLPPLSLWRPDAINERQVADAACGSGRFSLTYRYDFSALAALQAVNASGVSGLTSPPVVNGDTSVHVDFYDPTSRFNVGNMVRYGPIQRSCLLSAARQELVDAGQDTSSTTHLHSASCPDPRRVADGMSGQCQCVDTTASVTCNTLACFPSVDAATTTAGTDTSTAPVCRQYSLATIPGCYCQSAFTRALERWGTLSGLLRFTETDSDVCGDFIGQYLASQSLVLVTTASAVLVNAALTVILPALVEVEGHISRAAKARATVLKVTAAMVLNTLLTVVLVNAKPPNGVNNLPGLDTIGLLGGIYDDFTTMWYTTVGGSLCLALLINIVVSLALQLLQFGWFLALRRWAVRTEGVAVTQDELNGYMVGPEMNIALRVPTLIVQSTMALVYGSSMPLMYLMVTASFAAQYMLDRLLFRRYYANPLSVHAHLPVDVLNLIPLALLLHTAVGMWAYTAGGILPSLTPLAATGSVGTSGDVTHTAWLAALGGMDSLHILHRATRMENLPMLGALALGLAVFAFTWVAATVTRAFRMAAAMVCFGCVACAARHRNTTQSAVNRIKTARLVKGQFSSGDVAEGSTGSVVGLSALLPRFDLRSILTPVEFVRLWQLPTLTRTLLAEAAALRTLFKADPRRSAVEGVSGGQSKGLSPFSEEFSKVYASKENVQLRPALVEEGWRLQRLELQRLRDVDATCSKRGWEAARSQGLSLSECTGGNLKDKQGGLQAHGATGGKSASASTVVEEEPIGLVGTEDSSRPFTKSSVGIGTSVSAGAVASGGVGSLLPFSMLTPPESTHTRGLRIAHILRKFEIPACERCQDAQEAVLVGLQQPSDRSTVSGSVTTSGSMLSSPRPRALSAAAAVALEPLRAKKTWEVISESGLCSYDFMRAPQFQLSIATAIAETRGKLGGPSLERGSGISEGLMRQVNFGAGRRSSAIAQHHDAAAVPAEPHHDAYQAGYERPTATLTEIGNSRGRQPDDAMNVAESKIVTIASIRNEGPEGRASCPPGTRIV